MDDCNGGDVMLVNRIEVLEAFKFGIEEVCERAEERGGKIEEAAWERLSDSLEEVPAAYAALLDAMAAFDRAAEAARHRDDRAKQAVLHVHEEMTGAAGSTAALLPVFPHGPAGYVRALPTERAEQLRLLCARIRGAASPPWTAAEATSWTARLAAAAEPLEGALADVRQAAVARQVADGAALSAVVRAAHRLSDFRRDLFALGLSRSAARELCRVPPADLPRAA
jgi:hypothetical protein